MNYCFSCFRESESGYCLKCRKELFNGKKVGSILSFDSPYSNETDRFLDHTQKISISGVQIKYSLKLNGTSLELTDKGGQYILKPVPIGLFKHLDQAPANEHLTMQIARQIFKIEAPPNAFIRFSDGQPAYLVKRFDQNPSGEKIQQEDFAQLAQVTSDTHGENYKYDLSYEEIANLIRQYIPTYLIAMEKFLRLILFNYLFSNGDAHLKNFSVLRSAQGDYTLTPAYDLLCTKVHSPNESDMALSLFKNGFTSTYEALGFYSYADFLEFGKKIGIKEHRVKAVILQFLSQTEKIEYYISRSFLNYEVKNIYQGQFSDHLKRLRTVLK